MPALPEREQEGAPLGDYMQNRRGRANPAQFGRGHLRRKEGRPTRRFGHLRLNKKAPEGAIVVNKIEPPQPCHALYDIGGVLCPLLCQIYGEAFLPRSLLSHGSSARSIVRSRNMEQLHKLTIERP